MARDDWVHNSYFTQEHICNRVWTLFSSPVRYRNPQKGILSNFCCGGYFVKFGATEGYPVK